ncbi:MAG TPA: DUF5668 domain-containing protein [Anaerolineales bacterium]|nr:DUF5668 domain-containing protein [Anaerolineales bacterium]
MGRNRGSIIGGIVLIVIGGWLLAERFGVNLPGVGDLWPALLIIGGVAALIDYSRDRNADKVFFGVAGPLLGGFFFLFTLDRLAWSEMGTWWPVFVLISAVASVAQWIVVPARRGLLVQAAIALFVGLFFLAANLNLFSRALTNQILQLWPLALIVLGLVIIARTVRRTS